jgi:putative tricarboxylic transport membrane protein
MKILLILLTLLTAFAHATVLENATCIAPAKPGGGFDLTCQLVREALRKSEQTRTPLTITFQPGGIGALAFHSTVKQRPTDGRTVVAFSSGSLLNLAQGRFGPYTTSDVRWLAAIGMDYGVIAVRRDSPFHTLAQLLAALHESPNRIVFGAGGSIGSQDWMKVVLLAKAAGVSHKVIRFVAFEGGGDAISALRSDHVQVISGDAAEVARQIDQGAMVRVLAVFSDKRLAGRWSSTPTAKEQGYDIRWPVLRGIYLGPGVPDRDYRDWTDALNRAAAHASFSKELAGAGFQSGWLVGRALEEQINHQVKTYRQMATEFGLIR